MTLAMSLFREFFSGAMSGLPMRARKPKLKSVALALMEVLVFNSQILRGHAPFQKKFRGLVGTFPGRLDLDLDSTRWATSGSTLAKFDIHIFSHFGAISK